VNLIAPRVLLLVIGDGRDTLQRATLRSFYEHAVGHDLAGIVTVDDRHHLLGFCGAIRHGWQRIRESKAAFDYVFHLEEDWRFDRPFDLGVMSDLLWTLPDVAQVALRRGKEPAESSAPVDAWPEMFHDREHDGSPWLLHRSFFTTNPCLYRRSLVAERDWPEAPLCESAFTSTLVDSGMSFAYWGDRDDGAWITHTGQRIGTGY
jgi:hypothetical protein